MEPHKHHEGLKLYFELLNEIGWYEWDQNEPACSCPSSVTVKTVVPVVPPVWRRKGRQTGGQRPRRKMRAGFSEVQVAPPALKLQRGTHQLRLWMSFNFVYGFTKNNLASLTALCYSKTKTDRPSVRVGDVHNAIF